MDFISIFFILMSIVVITYMIYLFKTSKRLPVIIEIFYIGVYGFVFLIFLFPELLNIIESIFGIKSAINFFVYLSIFISYFIILVLYKKTEDQRVEITKLNRELAYLKNEKRK